MKFGVKFSPKMQEKDSEMLSFLEEKGVDVSGVELQLVPSSTPSDVEQAMEALRPFGLEFIGIHPPFPAFRKEAEPWAERFADKADYIVLHAGTKNSFFDLPSEMNLRGCFVENVIPTLERREQILGSLIETSLVSKNLLVDIPHLLHNYSRGIFWLPPWDQVKATASLIRAVHVADDGKGEGSIPENGGTEGFRKIFFTLLELCPDAFYIGEPIRGHLNNNEGHKANALRVWAIYQDFLK
jgi:hypothetical protein